MGGENIHHKEMGKTGRKHCGVEVTRREQIGLARILDFRPRPELADELNAVNCNDDQDSGENER